MALQNLAKFQMKRLNPFKGLIIDVPTWADAHNYHREQQRLHAMAMHQPGIVTGLEVVAWSPPDSSVVIYPGIAIDPDGNTIIIAEPQRFYLQTEESGTAYLIIQYREIPQERTQSLGEEKAQPLYVLEAYRMEERRQLPTEPYIELARVHLASGNTTIKDTENPSNPASNEIDTRYRTVSGPRPLGEIAIGLVHYPAAGFGEGWERHQSGIANLVQAINRNTNYRAEFKGSVKLSDEINDCDLLYMAGCQEFQFTDAEERALLNYLDRGGVLFGEACSEGGETRAFSQSFNSLCDRLGRSPRAVELGHPLFNVYHLFAIPPAGVNGQAVILEDKGVIYSDGDYGCVWSGGRKNKSMPRDVIRSALELGINIAVYSQQQKHYHALKIAGR